MTSLISAAFGTLRWLGVRNSLTRKDLRQLRIVFLFTKVLVLSVAFVTLAPQKATAQWTDLGKVNGVQVYRDEKTGLEWTQTIGQVQSSGWGAPARSLVSKHGFRLPSFRELQIMEANGGFRRLNINTRAQQYYETSNSSVLAAAWGNGFRTPQQRQGVGRNWVIGVRNPRLDEPIVVTPAPQGNSRQPTNTITNNPPANPTPVTPATVLPRDNKPVLPVLPIYD